MIIKYNGITNRFEDIAGRIVTRQTALASCETIYHKQTGEDITRYFYRDMPQGQATALYRPKRRPCRRCGKPGLGYFYCSDDCQRAVRTFEEDHGSLSSGRYRLPHE